MRLPAWRQCLWSVISLFFVISNLASVTYSRSSAVSPLEKYIESVTFHNQFGLHEIYSSDAPKVDIVAVHGLDGRHDDSWSAPNNVSWIRDLLPTTYPQSRILTYGYNAFTRGTTYTSAALLFNHADTFVRDLTNYRFATGTEDIPIIFVAHSLGGILVNRMLLQSSLSSHYRRKTLKLCTRGVLYFGSPHRGATGTRRNMLRLYLLSAIQPTNGRVLRHLISDSEYLQEQLHDFANIAGSFQTVFFYETEATQIAPMISMRIVPYQSAVIPGLPHSEMIELNANHVSMVKFHGPNDNNFKRVLHYLGPLVLESTQLTRGIGPPSTATQFELSELNTSPLHAPYRLPLELPFARNEKFVGRQKEIDEISHVLHSADGSTSRRTVVIRGAPGVGKSQLALEYAYRSYKNYSAVIWVSAKSASILLGDLITVAKTIRPSGDDTNVQSVSPDSNEWIQSNKEARVAKILVKSWLSKPDNDEWLLILDGADDYKWNDLKEIIPLAPHGKVIITTQNSELKRFASGEVLVGPMNQQDALDLLCSAGSELCASPQELKAAEMLANELGLLPLALDHAIAYVDAEQISWKACISDLWRDFYKFASKKPISWTYGVSLWSMWEGRMQKLRAQDKERQTCSVELLLWMSYMSSESISVEFLQILYTHYLPALEASACSVKDSLELLLQYSLIQRKERDKDYSMHQLVQTWVHKSLDPKTRAFYLFHTWNLISIVLNFKFTVDHFDNNHLPRPFDYEMHQLYAGVDDVRSHLNTLSRIQHQRLKFQVFHHLMPLCRSLLGDADHAASRGYLFQYVSNYLLDYGVWQSAESQLRKYMDQIAQDEEDHISHNEMMMAKLYLSKILYWQGDFDAARHLQQELLAFHETTNGIGHFTTESVRLLLARSLFTLNDIERARELIQFTLDNLVITEEDLWENQNNRLTAQQDLAWIDYREGDFQKASDAQMALLDQAVALADRDSQTTQSIKNDLALSLLATGNTIESQQVLEELIKTCQSFYGPKHPKGLIYKSNLARVYANQTKFAHAIPLMRDVISQWELVMPNHPARKLATQDLKTMLVEAKRYDEAKEVALEDLTSVEELKRDWSAPGEKLSLRLLWMALAVIFLILVHFLDIWVFLAVIFLILVHFLDIWGFLAVLCIASDILNNVNSSSTVLRHSSFVHMVQNNSTLEALSYANASETGSLNLTIAAGNMSNITDWVPFVTLGSKVLGDPWHWILVLLYPFFFMVIYDFFRDLDELV